MLTIYGNESRFCDGISRRNFLRIGALGLGTSLPAIAALGWRHVATVMGTTAVILVVVTAGLMMLR